MLNIHPLNQQNTNHQTQKYNNIKWTETNNNPGLVASYDFQPENAANVFSKEKIKKYIRKENINKQEKIKASYKKQKEASDKEYIQYTQTNYIAQRSTTPCLKKNDNDVAHYNFNAH